MKPKSAILIAFVLLGCALSTSAQTGIEIPAKLTDRPEQIIRHTGYTVSYNSTHGTPNWSAWVLTKAHVLHASEPRTPQFFADPLVPLAYRVQPSDYSNSGYDRGHMAPAADMSWSASAMHDCFYMSNMCPQAPILNRYFWKDLESACRKWALTEDTLYIVCGPIYKEPSKSIGKTHKIKIPQGFYKVVLSLRKNHQKAIGFYYSNSTQKQTIQATAKTVDEIEQLTGIDFFHSLEDTLEEQLESHFNLSVWR